MTAAARPAALPADSLAYALLKAADAVARVLGGSNLTEALARCWRENPGFPAATRGAVQDLAYGALRRYGIGDFCLGHLLHKPLTDNTLRALLLAAMYRLEARPEDAHTTVNQAVAAAATLQNGFVTKLANAVLRGYQRRRDELLALAEQDEEARWQHPRWWQARLKKLYPADWESVLAAGNGHPPMALRANGRQITPEDYLARLTEAGIGASLLEGGALLLDVGGVMRVLDACAAPGGKTAHILERGKFDMTALDSDATRLGKVRENLQRLGLSARLRAGDCRDLAAWWDGKPFQRILADVPCTASGVVRRHPDIKWLRRETDIASFAKTQAQILDALWQTLAPGGKLLYATCSVFHEENEGQVAAFAARHADCLRLPIDGAPALQLLPRDEHDGFFYALLAKQS